MAQLVPIAAVAGTAASLYGTVRQGQQQSANAKAQAQQQQISLDASSQQLAGAQATDARNRQDRLERTVASTRARLGASGVSTDQGSAGAITAGLAQDAAEAAAGSDSAYAARMAAGRSSLLNGDGSLTTWLRAGNSFGSAVTNLLD
jgi:hypothetical protein